jgi:hypothetical protein
MVQGHVVTRLSLILAGLTVTGLTVGCGDSNPVTPGREAKPPITDTKPAADQPIDMIAPLDKAPGKEKTVVDSSRDKPIADKSTVDKPKVDAGKVDTTHKDSKPSVDSCLGLGCTCTGDAVCSAGGVQAICVQNACVAGCNTNVPCANAGDKCCNSQCVTGNCCSITDCSNGQVCENNTCVDCTTSSQCGAGSVCCAGSGGKKSCVVGNCCTSPDCAGGQGCVSNVCRDLCSAVVPCKTGYKCCSGSCYLGDCCANSDCSGGLACIKNTCSSCTIDLQCSAGEICDSGKCTKGCNGSVTCGSGSICCTASSGGQCKPGSAGCKGTCFTGNCCIPSECGGGQYCSNNTCRTMCTTTADCGGGVKCCMGGFCYDFLCANGSGKDGAANLSGVLAPVSTRISGTIAAGVTAISLLSATGFSIGDKVLIIDLEGTNAGAWETVDVQSITGNIINLVAPTQNTYPTTDKVMVLRIPQYTDVTVGVDTTVPAFDRLAVTGGVLAFMATGTVTVASGAKLHANGAGFQGTSTTSGEGPTGAGCSGAPSCTGGAASGCMLANGGGGGGSFFASGCPAPGGGGGGHATAGEDGDLDSGGGCFGQGGKAYGDAQMKTLFFGSAGGAVNSGTQAAAGSGGGIVFVVASSIVNNGTISANGGAGAGGLHQAAGGGAGGSVYLRSGAGNVNALKKTTVQVLGGDGGHETTGCQSVDAYGGSGGAGYLLVDSYNYPDTCGNLAKDGDESDVDCGGSCPNRCALGVACTLSSDCLMGVCAGGKCRRAISCNELKAATPLLPDGVYSINPDTSGIIAPIDAYCDMTRDGGGWTMVMKAKGTDCVLAYNTNFWTTTNTLNPTDLTLLNTNAKFPAFNTVLAGELRATWRQIGHKMMATLTVPTTALDRFQAFQDLGDPTLQFYAGWPTETGLRKYGFNLTYNPGWSVRWGWQSNNEADWNSNDAGAGIGLNCDCNIGMGGCATCCTTVPPFAAYGSRVVVWGR